MIQFVQKKRAEDQSLISIINIMYKLTLGSFVPNPTGNMDIIILVLFQTYKQQSPINILGIYLYFIYAYYGIFL